jgi:hypothetical protein
MSKRKLESNYYNDNNDDVPIEMREKSARFVNDYLEDTKMDITEDHTIKNRMKDIDDDFTVSIQSGEGLVYLIILVHGCVMFEKNEPIFFTMPSNIKYVNKITYAPLNCVNFVTNDDLIVRSFIDFLNSENSDPTKPPIVESNLVKALPINDRLLETQKKDIEEIKKIIKFTKLYQFENRVINRQKLVEADSRDGLNTSFVFSTDFKDNIKIINKYFAIEAKDKEIMNIYVAFEKGGNKNLKSGKTILKSDEYISFLKAKFNIDDQKAREISDIITTQEILEFLAWCGYDKVVLIDYSCDVCMNIDDDTEVKIEFLKKIKEEIEKGTIGRGGVNTNKFTMSKRMKKSRKTIKKRVSIKSCRKKVIMKKNKKNI